MEIEGCKMLDAIVCQVQKIEISFVHRFILIRCLCFSESNQSAIIESQRIFVHDSIVYGREFLG